MDSSIQSSQSGPGQDPQILAIIAAAVQEQIKQVEQTYSREIAVRDDALRMQAEQGRALQAEIETLRVQLSNFRVDTHM
jgi:hypothetical protein